MLNRESVPGRFRAAKGWSPTTVGRILDNERYIGRWVWNKSELRRDPRTGRRRAFPKPASAWILHEDEALRIVPQALWDTVRARRQQVRRNWPGGKGKRGFSRDQRGRQQDFPTHLLSGAIVCGQCGASIAQISGKGGGYYGCLAASRGACDNKLLVRRALVEKIVLGAVRTQLSQPEHLHQILQRVAAEVQTLYTHVPETIRLKEAELAAEQRRLANFVQFIGEGRGSRTLAQALVQTEQKVDALKEELTGLQRSREQVFQAPPIEWIQERVAKLHEILERSPDRSGVLLRNLLDTLRLIPTKGDIGRPYYTAYTSLNTLALLDEPQDHITQPEGSSNSLHWWAREDLNLGPLPCQGNRHPASSCFS
jgi:site-specific DNA recombinase